MPNPNVRRFTAVVVVAAAGVIALRSYNAEPSPDSIQMFAAIGRTTADAAANAGSSKKDPEAKAKHPPAKAIDRSCEKKPYPDTVVGRYFHKYCAAAQHTQDVYHVPRALTLAMSAHESGFGGSTLAKEAHNFFGMKKNGDWKGPVYRVSTHEQATAAELKKFPDRTSQTKIGPDLYDITIIAPFRRYSSVDDNFNDFGNYLKTRHDDIHGRFYADAFSQTDPKKFLSRIVDDHGPAYATDRQYQISVDKHIDEFSALY